MEVIIATALLSVVMFSVYQVKSNNVYMVEKSTEQQVNKEYLMASLNTTQPEKRNENIYLDREFNNISDETRREFKKVKVKIKDKLLENDNISLDNISIDVEKYKTTYTIDGGISKAIYGFKLEF